MMRIISLTENDVPAIDLANATSAGTGEDHDRDGRKDYADKSDPSENTIAFGVWLVFLYVLPKQAR
jgi:hypothetical protein